MITSFTPDLFLLLAAVLIVMPFLTISSTIFIMKVYYHDTTEPRNRILRRMMHSGISIAIVSVFVFWLALEYYIKLFTGTFHADHVDFGGVAIAAAFVVLEIQPYLNYRSLKALDGNVKVLREIPEQRQEDNPLDNDLTDLL